MGELNRLFRHVYVNYFLLICSISNLIKYNMFDGVLTALLLLCSVWVLITSVTTIYRYHIKKDINIKGDKISE